MTNGVGQGLAANGVAPTVDDLRADGAGVPRSAHLVDPELPLQLWRRLDWRFLLPTPELGTVALAGHPDDFLTQALRLLDPDMLRLCAAGDVEPTANAVCDVVVLARPTYQDLQAALSAVRPGGWICAEVRRRQVLTLGGLDTLNRCSRAFRQAGLVDVEAYWHAPSIDACARILPVDRRHVVRETLGRYRGQPFGLAKSIVGRLALACGVFGMLVPEGTVLGQRPLERHVS